MSDAEARAYIKKRHDALGPWLAVCQVEPALMNKVEALLPDLSPEQRFDYVLAVAEQQGGMPRRTKVASSAFFFPGFFTQRWPKAPFTATNVVRLLEGSLFELPVEEIINARIRELDAWRRMTRSEDSSLKSLGRR